MCYVELFKGVVQNLFVALYKCGMLSFLNVWFRTYFELFTSAVCWAFWRCGTEIAAARTPKIVVRFLMQKLLLLIQTKRSAKFATVAVILGQRNCQHHIFGSKLLVSSLNHPWRRLSGSSEDAWQVFMSKGGIGLLVFLHKLDSDNFVVRRKCLCWTRMRVRSSWKKGGLNWSPP